MKTQTNLSLRCLTRERKFWEAAQENSGCSSLSEWARQALNKAALTSLNSALEDVRSKQKAEADYLESCLEEFLDGEIL